MGKDVNPEVSKMRLKTHTKLIQSILEQSYSIQEDKTEITRLKFDIKAVEKDCKSKYKKDGEYMVQNMAKVMNEKNVRRIKMWTAALERDKIKIQELKDKLKPLSKEMNASHKKIAKEQLINLKKLIK